MLNFWKVWANFAQITASVHRGNGGDQPVALLRCIAWILARWIHVTTWSCDPAAMPVKQRGNHLENGIVLYLRFTEDATESISSLLNIAVSCCKWENILNQCAFPHVHTPCPVLLLWVAYWRVDAKEIRMGTACHAADTVCAAMLQGKKRFRKQDLHFKQPRTPFHSAQLIIFLAPFLKSSNVTEMFPPPSLVQLQTKSCWHFMDSLQCYQRLMVTFPWRVQHLIFPNLKKLGYRHFISKVKFTLGCLFDIEHTPEQILWLTSFLCGGVI